MASLYPTTQYLVLNDPDVTATSWQVADGLVKINAQTVCKYKEISKGSITDAVTEVLQETQLAFGATNNSVYQFMIQQWNPYTQKTMTQMFTYTSDSTATTAEVYGYFKAAVDAAVAAGQLFLTTTTSASPNLIMKGIANYPAFTITIIQQPASGITPTYTTAGVVAVGTTAALALQGITVPSGKSYWTVYLEYAPLNGLNVKEPISVSSNYTLYIDKADAQTAALAVVIGNNLDGKDNAGTVANPEAIAIK